MADELRPYEVKVSRTVSQSEEATLYILAKDKDHARDLADTAMCRLPDGGKNGIWWEDEEGAKPESDCYDVTDVREAPPGSDAHKPSLIDWSDAIAAERDEAATRAAQQVFAPKEEGTR